ncbi:MAG: YjbF family lipoprotein [Rhodobacteraceae bacterium]|nr:YjbF family lipoprotein [Paracoccaceae bacterium]
MSIKSLLQRAGPILLSNEALGRVSAMWPHKMVRYGLLAGVMALTACGPLYSYRSGGEAAAQVDAGTGAGTVGLRGLTTSVASLFRPPQPQPRPEQVLTPEALAQIQQPFLLMFFGEAGGGFGPTSNWGGFAEAGFNGDVVTWVEGSARTISTTRGGLLLATRGYGRDLMTARADRLQAVISGRSGGAQRALRVHRFLDGENAIVTASLVCRITNQGPSSVRLLTGIFATRQIEEACLLADGTEVINRYWVDLGGTTIRQSEQWVSPEIGSVRLQRLR